MWIVLCYTTCDNMKCLLDVFDNHVVLQSDQDPSQLSLLCFTSSHSAWLNTLGLFIFLSPHNISITACSLRAIAETWHSRATVEAMNAFLERTPRHFRVIATSGEVGVRNGLLQFRIGKSAFSTQVITWGIATGCHNSSFTSVFIIKPVCLIKPGPFAALPAQEFTGN